MIISWGENVRESIEKKNKKEENEHEQLFDGRTFGRDWTKQKKKNEIRKWGEKRREKERG